MWEESFRITTKEEITLFRGKKYQDAAKQIEKNTQYDAAEGFGLICKTASAKFDETVELHVRLGVDGRHADQQVRGAVVLPNGTGKTVRVCAIAKGAAAAAAAAAQLPVVKPYRIMSPPFYYSSSYSITFCQSVLFPDFLLSVSQSI